MKLDLAMFSSELQKTSPKTIVNGLSFFVRKNATNKKKKKKKKMFMVKLWQKNLMFVCLQRLVTFSHPVLVKFTKKQIIILKTCQSQVFKDSLKI